MKPTVWRWIAVAYGVTLLALAVTDVYAGIFVNGGPGFTTRVAGPDLRELTVTGISNRGAIAGPLAVGDRIRFVDQSFENRVRFARTRPGDRFAFTRITPGGQTSTFVDTIVSVGPAPALIWSFEFMGVVFVAVALVVALRRPDEELARLLVGLFLTMGTVLVTGPQSLMPPWLLVGLLAVHLFAQPFAAYAALALAVSFPHHAAGGIRRFFERANIWMLLLCLVVLFASYASILGFQHAPPPGLRVLGIGLTVAYYAAITIAFVVAGRTSSGADRKRLQWVAWTFAAGFSGEAALLIAIIARVPLGDWMAWFNLTLVAIPFGLGYAIVRHRVVDIGFVVNRALVFGSVSAIVVIAFMALEWALSNVFVKVSHITSTSLELGLALVLGFSLRTIHAKVDHFVDDLFFRDRHAAERALRTLAREVGYITEPRVALARAHGELSARTGTTEVTMYLMDGPVAVRVDPAQSTAPETVDVDDVALVRLRATRAPLALRNVPSAVPGEHAFPMLVHDMLTGLIVLGPKANGEAYAPDEIATVETVALALGAALDALQTTALKAEIAHVLVGGTSLDELRRTADVTTWLRGVVLS